jgi:hypothetical protein
MRPRRLCLTALLAAALGGPAFPRAAAAPASTKGPAAADPDQATTVEGVTVEASKIPYAKQYGAVVGDIKPEIQLNPSDIQSYGVSTVTDLLTELAPQLRSDRGRGGGSPVVLLNGRRISSINEIISIPTEAIQRVDILPEEVSLKYGYSADQRVVNIVLRRYFRAVIPEATVVAPTEGGEITGGAEIDSLSIRRGDRINLDVKYAAASGLDDAARGIIQTPSPAPYDVVGNVVSASPGAEIDPALSALAGERVTVAGVPNPNPSLSDFVPTANLPRLTDQGHDRSLSPATQSVTVNAVLAHPLPRQVNATVNATLSASTSDQLQGLPGAALETPAGNPFSPFGEAVDVDRYDPRPLHQYTDGWTGHLGSTLNRDVKDWRLSLTGAYDHADSQTDTDAGIDIAPLNALLAAGSPRFNPFAPFPPGLVQSLPQSYARSISDSGNIQLLASGPVIKLPGGNLYISGKVGDTESRQDSAAFRRGLHEAAALSRNDFNAQLNVDIPLISHKNPGAGAVGDLSVNVNASLDQVSDYGTLKTFGYGLNWTPIPAINLILSHTNDQAAPTIAQLGGPLVETPGVPVYDYATGQTVNVLQITGGNHGLLADNRNVSKVGLTLKPIPSQNLTITANYIKSDVDHPIQAFPAASAEIQAAFPDRFIRDASGQLVEEDVRPVNFSRSERSELRWGVNYSRPLGKQPPQRFNRAGLNAERGADGAYRGGASAGGDRGGGADYARYRGYSGPPAGGRFQVALYHTVYFTDRLFTRPGGPVLDLLGGSAASSTGGQYRNEIEGQLGATLHGAGFRLSVDWKQATFVTGAATASAGDLSFSDITTINLRLFDNLGQQRSLVKRYSLFKGARVVLSVSNLLDQRVSVKDATGATPLGYQPGYIDPVGRTISLTFRKLID